MRFIAQQAFCSALYWIRSSKKHFAELNRALSPPRSFLISWIATEKSCVIQETVQNFSMNRIAPARELFHGLFRKYRKKNELECVVDSLHHLRCYLETIVHDCGTAPFRLLFRHYVACSPRFQKCRVPKRVFQQHFCNLLRAYIYIDANKEQRTEESAKSRQI